MVRIILFLLFCIPLSVVSQMDTVAVLINKGDAYLDDQNFEQASYFYKLALKHDQTSNKKGLFQSELEEKIHLAEKLIAYSSNNERYVNLICRADSLTTCCEIVALKTYQEAFALNPNCSYPSLQMDSILNSSPEIQKKLLVISAKRKRRQYLSDLDLADFYYQQKEYLKAYKEYEKILVYYPDDTISTPRIMELNSILASDLSRFEKNLQNAEYYFHKEKYGKAEKLYRAALQIDSDCNICKIKLKSIAYLEKKQQKKTDWGQLSKEAEENYRIGNYEMAHYQYIWLYKHDPTNVYVQEKIEEINQLLEEEIDEKHALANAKLLLEQADNYFIAGKYQLAKDYYQKIANRYDKSVDSLIYVVERIKDCDHYLENQ